MKRALFTLPKKSVVHLNMYQSPCTYGFPAYTAWLGLMDALNRRLGGISLEGVAILNYRFEPHLRMDKEGYWEGFSSPRNSLGRGGKTQAFQDAQGGTANAELSFVFLASYEGLVDDALAAVAHQLSWMRFAGGSIFPGSKAYKPWHMPLCDDLDVNRKELRKHRGRWRLGSVMSLRPGLLKEHWESLRESGNDATKLDAWLDLFTVKKTPNGTKRARPGWLVPVTTGFQVVGDVHPPGTLNGTRDNETPFAFAESILDVAEWTNASEVEDLGEMLVQPSYNPETQTFRAVPYQPNNEESPWPRSPSNPPS